MAGASAVLNDAYDDCLFNIADVLFTQTYSASNRRGSVDHGAYILMIRWTTFTGAVTNEDTAYLIHVHPLPSISSCL